MPSQTSYDAYSVSQRNPHVIFWYFSQTVGNFSSIFYTPIVRSYLRLTSNFYSSNCNFDEVMPYYVRPPSVRFSRWWTFEHMMVVALYIVKVADN